MKVSKYNVFFKHEESIVGFNGFSQEYIFLDELLIELYKSGEKQNSFEELKEVYIEYYNFLIEKGFLIEDSIDEFEKVKQISQEIDNNEVSYTLTINPTMNCNFKCWYCYETHIKDSKMNSDTINSTIKFIENLFIEKKQLKNLVISWFGGEPLLYFDKVIRPILSNAKRIAEEYGINLQSGITTNALLINQDYLSFCMVHSLNHFQITLDGDKERHDKVRFITEGKGSYDKIFSNILLIAENKLTASIRINCSDETLKGLPNILEDFKNINSDLKKFIKFDFHKVWQVEEDIEDDLIKYRLLFRDNGFSVRGGIYDTVVNSCYADKKNHATINYNGEVFKCTARDFKSDGKEGLLSKEGIISWNEKLEKRLNSKFNNPPCRECKILPICGGGCSQQALEHEGKDYCVHNFDEDSKLKAVKSKFLETLSENEIEFS